MTTETEKATLRKELEKYEGRQSHMYLDSKGYVTVGVGHLLRTVVDAQKLAFKNGYKPATKAEIKTDYEMVKKQLPNRLASYYKRYTKLTLPNIEIDKLTNQHIQVFAKELKQIYSGFDMFPSPVRLALFDMIFNLGMTKLKNNWPKFNRAIKAGDWQAAASESKRKPPVSDSRNKYVKDLLEKAAKNANTTAKTSKP